MAKEIRIDRDIRGRGIKKNAGGPPRVLRSPSSLPLPSFPRAARVRACLFESGRRKLETQPPMASTGVEQQQEEVVVTVDMPAPEGWAKKFTPQRAGRSEVIFVSPTGVEIKNKRQLNQYLKANPGGPASSEFDWGTGETPRRSSRISEKVKVFDSPEGEKIPKRSRNSSGRKGKQEKKEEAETEEGKEAEAGKEAPEAEAGKEAPSEDAAKSTDVEMKPVEEANDAAKTADAEMKPVEEVKTAPSEDAGKTEVKTAPSEDAGKTEVKTAPAEDAGKTEDSADKVDVPAPALVENKKQDEKVVESDSGPALAENKEDGKAAESDAVPAPAEGKKEGAKQAENDGKEEVVPAAAAPEAKAEAAAPVESSATVDGQPAAVNNGQMSPGVKCT